MSQLTIFTGKRQSGQTPRLVEAIIEKAKTHKVVCFAYDSVMAKELFAKLRLKIGVIPDTGIPNIDIMNICHAYLFNSDETLNSCLYDTPVAIAIDDVPLGRLAWLTEWSTNYGIHVLASYSSDAEFNASLSLHKVTLSTEQLLRQLSVLAINIPKLSLALEEISIDQSFVVVNVEDCALTLNITDPQKSDLIFAASSKLTPGVKFEVTRLSIGTWQLSIADKQ